MKYIALSFIVLVALLTISFPKHSINRTYSVQAIVQCLSKPGVSVSSDDIVVKNTGPMIKDCALYPEEGIRKRRLLSASSLIKIVEQAPHQLINIRKQQAASSSGCPYRMAIIN